MYFFKRGSSFITIAMVVDDMAIASNYTELLSNFKKATAMKFDLSLFGELKTFLGWRFTRSSIGIRIDQEMYTTGVIREHYVDLASL